MFGINGLGEWSTAALAIGGLISLAIFILFVIAYVKIISRAGYSGWWVLILIVPVVNVIMLLVFAFKRWPIQEELDHYRSGQGGYGGYNTGGYPQNY